jgi:hypothetical protein
MAGVRITVLLSFSYAVGFGALELSVLCNNGGSIRGKGVIPTKKEPQLTTVYISNSIERKDNTFDGGAQ